MIPQIAIVDYGMGNLGSIRNMLERVGASAAITSDPDQIRGAEKMVLPGVGSFDTGMTNLEERGLVDLLNELVLNEGKPILGICLGVQLFTRSSDEGELPGLGWIAGDTRRFALDDRPDLKIPHMGWNLCEPVDREHLFAEMEEPARFYFVHSYHLACDDAADVLCHATYGYRFAAGVRRGNIYGVQFHPEKSLRFGLTLLQNFTERI